ncbi:MAG: lysine--tRNA ligase [Patescibacteria group bacterium]
MTTIKEEYLIRIDKAAALRAAGMDPYASVTPEHVEIKDVTEHFDEWMAQEKSVTIVGRLMTTRIHGKMAFADLQDESSIMQIQLTEDKTGAESFARFIDYIDPADFISATGTLFLTKRGQKTLAVTSWNILTKSLRPLPDKFHGLTDVEMRFRERELDLVSNPDVRHIFRLRASVLRSLRDRLNEAGFEEVETPVLQPIAGGATARPFATHHNALGHDFYLRIAPELYLKRCVVGGMTRVYELGRQFRNEGIDWSHNPEFTSLEFYWAYQDYQSLMTFTESFLSGVIQDVLETTHVKFDEQDINFTPSWPRVRFCDAVKNGCGVDIEEVKTQEELVKIMREKGIEADSSADLGTLYDDLYKFAVRSKQIQPIFVIDYPIEMEPLAKRCVDNPKYVQRFQLLAGGMELLKAYTELNDPMDQRARFEEQQKMREGGNDEAQSVDEQFLKALEHGLPPTAGLGMGIDRFVMMLANAKSVKEVILFPTLRPEGESSV